MHANDSAGPRHRWREEKLNEWICGAMDAHERILQPARDCAPAKPSE
ncbi:hypothetical protein [Corynebacterium argentoratense]|nr:hypothetical protein [Corynebacterium argentoratense]MCF1765278.1 hypothetical protein [Corynebacterium argentoratense]